MLAAMVRENSFIESPAYSKKKTTSMFVHTLDSVVCLLECQAIEWFRLREQ